MQGKKKSSKIITNTLREIRDTILYIQENFKKLFNVIQVKLLLA